MQVRRVGFVALVIESEPVSPVRLDLNWAGPGKGLPVDGPVIYPFVPCKLLPENKRDHLHIPRGRVSLPSEDGVVPASAGRCGPLRWTFAVCVFHNHSQAGVPRAVIHLAENPDARLAHGNDRVDSLRRAKLEHLHLAWRRHAVPVENDYFELVAGERQLLTEKLR